MIKIKKYLILIFLILLNNLVFSQRANDVAKNSFKSVVMIVMEDSHGQPLKLGSGFFVASNLIATNLHVIENSKSGYVKIISSSKKYNIEGFVGVDYSNDLIILKINTNNKSLNIIPSDNLEVGEEIYAIGNPQGLEGTISQGIISGIRNIDSKKLLQITAPISPGSSGGPILNKNSEVIGIAVSTYINGQNLNFAVPSSYLIKLLKNKQLISNLSNLLKSELSISPNESSLDMVVGENFQWTNRYCINCGEYTFSLRNKLRDDITDIYCLVIFYSKYDNIEPIDFDIIHYNSIIPGNLAKRIGGAVDHSTVDFSTVSDEDIPRKVEFRILDFRISN